jgi:simple sugar transport system ATP-binding protein
VATVPVIEVRGVVKKFSTVVALDQVDFDVLPGEVVALIGDNGAGKSTLVKVLSGVHTPDSGQVLIDGERVHLDSPRQAKRAGIETVHQDLALAPHLSAVENLYLGRELAQSRPWGRLGFLRKKQMQERTEAIFADLGVRVTALSAPVGRMSGGQRQGVAIARAVAWTDKVLILDEPTSALGVEQTANVLDTVRRVRDRGVAVVFVSHTMPHVIDVADRIQVLRRGRRVASLQNAETSMEDLVAYMTGAKALL